MWPKTFHSEITFEWTTAHQESLSLLYLPLIGSLAHSLYHFILHLCDRASQSSLVYPASFLADALAYTPQTLTEARHALEAIGLIKTFEEESHHTYQLQAPLLPDAFKRHTLAAYLKTHLAPARTRDIFSRLRLSKHTKPQGKDISQPFDRKFGPLVEPPSEHSPSLTLTHPTDVNSVLEAIPTTLLTEEQRRTLQPLCEQLCFVYSLNEMTLKDVLLEALASQEPLDALHLSRFIHPRYQSQKPAKNGRKDVYYFTQKHPKEVVHDATGHQPSAHDLRIIERLLTEAHLPLEVLNVLIIYVLNELDGQMPSYGYFERVIAQWHRKKIRSAQEALEHVYQAKQPKVKTPPPSRRRSKHQGPDVSEDWFQDYMKKFEDKS